MPNVLKVIAVVLIPAVLIPAVLIAVLLFILVNGLLAFILHVALGVLGFDVTIIQAFAIVVVVIIAGSLLFNRGN